MNWGRRSIVDSRETDHKVWVGEVEACAMLLQTATYLSSRQMPWRGTRLWLCGDVLGSGVAKTP